MRRLFYILIAYCFSLISCTNEGVIEEQTVNDSDRIIMIGINLAGDIDTDESPLSRAETYSRDLIGIQVYKHVDSWLEPYCFGLFDNLRNAIVALQAGSKYCFESSIIRNGKDFCQHYDNGYMRPFALDADAPFLCNNEFEYSSRHQFYYLSDGSIAYETDKGKWKSDTYCGPADRFYGELSNYTPSVNGTITIPLRRVSCGIKVKVLGVTDGTAKVKCYNDYNTFYENSAISGSVETEGTMYCMANVKDAWQYADDDYQEPIKMSVVWTRGNGIIQNLGTKTVYVKRNVMNTIKIKLSTNDSDVDVDVDPEKGGLDEEDEDLSN